MQNERDTQFKGFAKLLMADILSNNPASYNSTDEFIVGQEQIIARRAYDFMRHVLANTPSLEFGLYGDDYVVDLLPDMTEWPKESE